MARRSVGGQNALLPQPQIMFMICSMSMASSASDPALAEPIDPDRERAERHGRMLARLGELALGLAEAVQGQAVESTQQPPEHAADRTRGLGLVFARLSYEVRQTVALEARLAADSRTTAAERAATATEDRRRRRLNLVRRILSEAIEAREIDEAEAGELDVIEEDRREDLLFELDHRLRDEATQDIDDLPVGELVARFCRELRFEPDWSRWQDETWAVEESGHPLSPYHARPPDARPPDARPEESDAPADIPADPEHRGAPAAEPAAKPDSS